MVTRGLKRVERYIMFKAGSKLLNDFEVLGPMYGFQVVNDIDYEIFVKKPWEKNKLKILKNQHQDHCREKGMQYKGLSHKHLISKTS